MTKTVNSHAAFLCYRMSETFLIMQLSISGGGSNAGKCNLITNLQGWVRTLEVNLIKQDLCLDNLIFIVII